MRHTFHDTRTGAEVAEHVAFDEHGCIRSGFAMRTKVQMRDDGHALLTDEQKSDAIEARNKRLCDAWKNPVPLVRMDDASVRDAAIAAISDSYERYDARLANAWR